MTAFNELLKPVTVRNVAVIETKTNKTAEPFSFFLKLVLNKIIRFRQSPRLVPPKQQLALRRDS